MAKLIKPDMDPTELLPKSGKKFTLEEMQEIVGGDIQIVPIRGNFLIMNEEGRRLKLPRNITASLLWGDDVFGTVLLATMKEVD